MLIQTTLTAPISASQLQLSVAAAPAGLPPFGLNLPTRIDGEYLITTGAVNGQTLTVRARGSEGTLAVPHDLSAIVEIGTTAADFSTAASPLLVQNTPAVDATITIGQDSQTVPLTVPNVSTTYYIAKAGICAILLGSGTPMQQGVVLTFISMTPFAHTLTYPPGFFGTGAASDGITLTPNIGACVVLEVTSSGTLVITSLPNNLSSQVG